MPNLKCDKCNRDAIVVVVASTQFIEEYGGLYCGLHLFDLPISLILTSTDLELEEPVKTTDTPREDTNAN